MLVSQKCRYALRAIFELARRHGMGPVKNSEIAQAQAIPARFLELIMNQLKRGGFVASRRGRVGGYVLLHDPTEVTIGSVVRFIQGPLDPARCAEANSRDEYTLRERGVFLGMWERVRESISKVYDGTTFQDLLDEDARLCDREFVPSYAI
ncbi:MAG TPA: Rrf2 family transcriptional regulator [Planctomycetota bacterium]|nr:Rrf2 family transcriptional regulator [Planctomycetota bacterium]